MDNQIVLLDDDVIFLRSLKRELGEDMVVAFHEAQDFIDYVETSDNQISMVCVDLNLPDLGGVNWQLGGLSVIRELRTRMGADVPFVCVLTGMDVPTHIHTCLKNGADAFVEKDHSVPMIAKKIVEHVVFARSQIA